MNKLRIKLINIQLEQKVPYLEQHRPMGAGEHRIGGVVALENDIFGFAYCILLRDRYIFENLNIFKGEFWEEEDFAERDEILELYDKFRKTKKLSQLTSIQDEGESVEFFSTPSIEASKELFNQKRLMHKIESTLQYKRQTIRIHAYLCAVFQALLAVLVFYELYTNSQYICELWYSDKQEVETVVAFICINMLHLQLIETGQRYLMMGKFAINHPY
jgi:hypothetical protein